MKQSIINYLQIKQNQSIRNKTKRYFQDEINKVEKSKDKQEIFKILCNNFK